MTWSHPLSLQADFSKLWGTCDKGWITAGLENRLWNGQQGDTWGCSLSRPHLTWAAMFFFVHLVCLLIQLSGDMTTLWSPSFVHLPHSLSIPGTGDLMKSLVTMNDPSHPFFFLSAFWMRSGFSRLQKNTKKNGFAYFCTYCSCSGMCALSVKPQHYQRQTWGSLEELVLSLFSSTSWT